MSQSERDVNYARIPDEWTCCDATRVLAVPILVLFEN